MNQNPTTEQPIDECCYCDKPAGNEPVTHLCGSMIHQRCCHDLSREMDAIRTGSPIPDDGFADGGEPYTDEEIQQMMETDLQAYYGFGQGG